MCHRTWRLPLNSINTHGDSMKGTNAKDDLLAQSDSDGGLIGVASLQEEYFNIINRVVKQTLWLPLSDMLGNSTSMDVCLSVCLSVFVSTQTSDSNTTSTNNSRLPLPSVSTRENAKRTRNTGNSCEIAYCSPYYYNTKILILILILILIQINKITQHCFPFHFMTLLFPIITIQRLVE